MYCMYFLKRFSCLCDTIFFFRSSRESSVSSPPLVLSPSRPQLRRESAQDLGDGDVGEGKMNASLGSKKPPDLKIDLLSDTSSIASTVSPRYLYFLLETIEVEKL